MIHKSDFMCRCSPESREEAQACLDRVKEKLGAEDSTLLTAVVFELNWHLGDPEREEAQNFYGHIDGIHNDQWSAVSVKVMGDPGDKGRYEEVGRVRVRCDRVEDGIARAYELAEEAVLEAREG